jgi:hypothetical protein
MSKNVFIARSNEPINYMELNHMECRQAVNHYFAGKLFMLCCGECRSRTDDPLLAKQVL